MKKTVIIFSVAIIALTLSGCGSNQKSATVPNPVTDPGGYDAGMIGIKDKAQQDINNATDQENNQLNNN